MVVSYQGIRPEAYVPVECIRWMAFQREFIKYNDSEIVLGTYGLIRGVTSGKGATHIRAIAFFHSDVF